jgi:hypothetical protein
MEKRITRKNKTFLEELKILIVSYWKKEKIDELKRKEQVSKLSFKDKREYYNLGEVDTPYSLLYYPFIAMFWIALFVFVVKLGLGIDLIIAGKLLSGLIFKCWFIFVLVYFLILFSIIHNQRRLRKEYLEDKFKNER